MKQKKNSLQTTHYKLRTRCVSRGVSLIDTLVGTALMLVIFLGIAGAIQLSLDVVTNNKARAGAIALANERMEYIRSLAYASVGTVGGIPSGTLAQTETTTMNGITYTRRTFIEYSDDSKDGTGGADTNGITADYKAAKVSVSWTSRTGERSVAVVTRIESLNGMEIACTPPCGTLALAVVDSQSQPVSNAQVAIVNSGTGVNLNTYSDTSGIASFIGSPAGSGYQITVTKAGYSTSQTYSATSQNTGPNPAHLTVSNNQTTSYTFGIDTLGQKTVNTYIPILAATWTDPFANSSLIATTSNTTISGGEARLDGAAPYPEEGTLQSVSIAPTYLALWKQLSWTDAEPSGTSAVYHVYNSGGTSLIPDSQLPGNSAGFTESPISLSGVSTSTYTGIRLGATLSSDSTDTSTITDWNVSYDYGPQPLPNIPFTLRGAKTIGTGPSGTLYKYDVAQNSGAGASLTIPNLEWDLYSIIINSSTGYNVSSACNPQPESLAAGASQTSSIFLLPATTNSMLVDVRSSLTGALLPNASVRLRRTGYDTTVQTDSCGQAFFSGLSASNYQVTVTMSGYTTYDNTAVSVSGATTHSVGLN